MKPQLLVRDGLTVSVEATLTGKLRIPIRIVSPEWDTVLLVDEADPVRGRDRDRLLAQLPDEMREEAGQLLRDLANELIELRQSELIRSAATDRPVGVPALEPWPQPV